MPSHQIIIYNNKFLSQVEPPIKGGEKMKLYQVVLKDILRRKKRVLYATLGVVIATMTVVGILTIAQAGQARIYAQLEKYGANLSVIPATKSLTTGLGDLTLGTVTSGETYISQDKIPKSGKLPMARSERPLKLIGKAILPPLHPNCWSRIGSKRDSVIFVGVDPTAGNQYQDLVADWQGSVFRWRQSGCRGVDGGGTIRTECRRHYLS